MAQGLILEFGDTVGRTDYDAVNAALDISAESGEGRWPSGLLYHAGGEKPGGWVVFEVWESKDAQGQFMAERLGPALAQCGVGAPTRVEWVDLAAHVNLAG